MTIKRRRHRFTVKKFLSIVFILVVIYGGQASAAEAETGNYGENLDGLALEIYNQCADLTPKHPAITINWETEIEDADVLEDYVLLSQEWKSFGDEYREVYSEAMFAYKYDHPEETAWTTGKVGIIGARTGLTGVIQLYYRVSDYYSDELMEEAQTKLDQIVAEVPAGDRASQVKYIHDWICLNATYDDEENVAESSGETTETNKNSEDFYYAHSPFGVLLRGKGICEGYAKTFKILCDRLGIPCICVMTDTSESPEAHMWNYVQLDNGKWYIVDCTLDDQESGIGRNYKYFLVSSKTVDDSLHQPNSSRKVPKTSGYDYVQTDPSVKASLAYQECTYSGKFKKPAVTLKYNGKTMKSGTDYVVVYEDNFDIGTATVRIYGTGRYQGYTTLTFTIIPQCSKITLKKVTSKKKLLVKWKKVYGVDGYQIQYCTTKTYAKGYHTIKLADPVKMYYTIKTAKRADRYYVRIRTFKKTGGKMYYSKWK